MKEQCIVGINEAQQMLDKLCEILPVKYGNAFGIVQQFFVEKFKDDDGDVTQISDNNVEAVSTYGRKIDS